MSINKFLIIIIIVLVSNSTHSQENYAFFNRYNDSTQKYLKQRYFKSVKLITNSSIVDENNNINEKTIKQNLKRILLSTDDLLVIDWEKEDFWNLKLRTDSKEFIKAEKQFIRLIKIIRKNNPNIKIGIYGLPFKVYYNLNASYNEKGKFDKILSLVDVICPSFYFNFTDDIIGKEKNIEIITNQLINCLEYGERLNKPVIPFVWELIHPSTKDIGGTFVPKDEFKRHLKLIINFKFKNEKVSGLIWWSPGGASEIYRSLSEDNTLSAREIRSRTLIEYVEMIKK